MRNARHERGECCVEGVQHVSKHPHRMTADEIKAWAKAVRRTASRQGSRADRERTERHAFGKVRTELERKQAAELVASKEAAASKGGAAPKRKDAAAHRRDRAIMALAEYDATRRNWTEQRKMLAKQVMTLTGSGSLAAARQQLHGRQSVPGDGIPAADRAGRSGRFSTATAPKATTTAPKAKKPKKKPARRSVWTVSGGLPGSSRRH